ncbi:MAG: deoxyribose-phosphate aldolase [Elusimicrobia bacterium]|nr:deoxyribose-phosphate aldolase [Elusimicrobiota bacterium]
MLKGSECGCSAAPAATPAASRPVRVTTGTAGKVFSDAWRGPVLPARPEAPEHAPARAPSKAAEDEGEHTAGPNCPHCAPVAERSRAQLAELGVDRIAVCHPTKNCSQIAKTVDHTLLKPNATQEEVAKLCEEARAYCFASVCVNPSYVALSAKLLRGSGVKVCTVVGFPLGSTTPTVKAIEARDAIANGADEIDMVINIGALKSGNDALALDDIKAVREATRGRVLKVILETSLLTSEEKVRACAFSKQAGADFVKTSTGFSGGGATVEDVRLMRETVGPLMGVKASGGIRDTATAQAMISAGATRLGTSASVAIVTDQKPASPGGTGAAGGKY